MAPFHRRVQQEGIGAVSESGPGKITPYLQVPPQKDPPGPHPSPTFSEGTCLGLRDEETNIFQQY